MKAVISKQVSMISTQSYQAQRTTGDGPNKNEISMRSRGFICGLPFFAATVGIVILTMAIGASAAVITPVSANASSVKSGSPGSSATYLIDGSGLFTDATKTIPDNSLAGIHFDNGLTWSWVWQDGSILIRDQWVEFDLGGFYNLTDAYIWQTTYSNTGRQTQYFDIETSTDDATYTAVNTTGSLQLGQVTTLASGSMAETFSFSTGRVRYVRIAINGTYERPSGDRTWLGGLGEVRFEGTLFTPAELSWNNLDTGDYDWNTNDWNNGTTGWEDGGNATFGGTTGTATIGETGSGAPAGDADVSNIAFQNSSTVAIDGPDRLLFLTPGTITVEAGSTPTINADVAGGFVKDGVGSLSLNGAVSGKVTVAEGTLKGTATVGTLDVGAGGAVSPGNSVGTLSAGDAVWHDGGTLVFEIADATGPAGTGHDLLNVTVTLDLSAVTANGITIAIDTLAGASPGPMANFNKYQDYDWEFARAGAINGFDATKFQFDASGLVNDYDGTFEVTRQGNSLYVSFRTSLELPDPGQSAVVAAPASVPADGTTTSTITVTLMDALGSPVPDMDVTLDFAAGSPGLATIEAPATVTTGAEGTATFTVKSATVGTETFQATSTTGATIAVGTVDVEFTAATSIVSQTSLISGWTPAKPPAPGAPQTSLATTTASAAPDSQTPPLAASATSEPAETPAPGVVRVTEYYLTDGAFAGTETTVVLDRELAADYFILVRGSRAGAGLSMPDSDYARVASVPGGRGGLPDSGASDAIGLRRAAAEFAWEGVVTVVECLDPDSPAGFRLVDAVSATLSGATGSLTCAPWGDASRVVPFGGYRGGGVELTGGAASRYDGVSAYVRLAASGTDTLVWQRDAGGETLADATMTVFVVEWGSGWTVQHASVAGSNGGDGTDAAGEYTTAAIAPVARANTWVWGTGIRADAGTGDCAESCVVTLGDGVNLNAVEGAVAVGSEYTDAYSFDVYALTHPALAVDHRFKPDGDLKGLDIPVGVAPAAPGARFAWLYNGCNGTSSRFPRPRMWSRYTDDGTVTISRGYDGAQFPAWIQGIDFSGLAK